ncbi:MAG: WYL domain-containing protein [Proteobacteria bacterium]|nr:MAG: WYL domain-containing protein [Pseudomonadota bacterium]
MAEGNRNAQTVRLEKIKELLLHSKFGYTIAELHAKLSERGFAYEERTIRRDIQGLEISGFPLLTTGDKSSGIRWRLESNTSLKHIMPVKQSALMGIYLLRGLASSLEDSPFQKDVEDYFKTIEMKLGDKGQEFLKELEDSIKFSQQVQLSTRINRDILATLQSACAERQKLEVIYESAASGLQTRTLGPHALYFDHGSLYFLADDLIACKTKTYAVARFSEAKMLPEPFEGEIIDPKKFFDKTFGVFEGSDPHTIAIEVDRALAPFLSETIWHSSQASEPMSNGNTMLRFHISLTPDFVNWVMSFGSKVYVHEPKELQDQICDAATAVQKAYQSKRVI